MKKLYTAAAVLGVGVAVLAGSFEVSAQQAAGKVPWKRMPGVASDVGAGGGQVWRLDAKGGANGKCVFRWNGKTWDNMSGEAVRIDVGPRGLAWVVNAKQQIFRHNGAKWVKMPGKARDIGVGADGSVWVIGTNKVNGGFSIHRLRKNGWQRVAGGGVRIDVAPDGNAWVVNDKGQIYRFDGQKWQRLPGAARDIAIGGKAAAPRVWVAGTNKGQHGGSVFTWTGKGWRKMTGQTVNMTADAKGLPIGLNNKGFIYAHASSQVWTPASLTVQDKTV